MNEKQRWLLRELEVWREAEIARIGRYELKRKPKEPTQVRMARRTVRVAQGVIDRWKEKNQKAWRRQKADVDAAFMKSKRAILFEKTEVAVRVVMGVCRG